jgi:tellurite resistance protein TerA
VPDWAAADPVVRLHPVAGPRIEVPLVDPDSSSPLVAVALLDRDGDAVAVHREVRWVRGGQQKLDELYDWGMEWRSARAGE